MKIEIAILCIDDGRVPRHKILTWEVKGNESRDRRMQQVADGVADMLKVKFPHPGKMAPSPDRRPDIVDRLREKRWQDAPSPSSSISAFYDHAAADADRIEAADEIQWLRAMFRVNMMRVSQASHEEIDAALKREPGQ